MLFAEVRGVGRDEDAMGEFQRSNPDRLKARRKLRVGRVLKQDNRPAVETALILTDHGGRKRPTAPSGAVTESGQYPIDSQASAHVQNSVPGHSSPRAASDIYRTP